MGNKNKNPDINIWVFVFVQRTGQHSNLKLENAKPVGIAWTGRIVERTKWPEFMAGNPGKNLPDFKSVTAPFVRNRFILRKFRESKLNPTGHSWDL
jgi:hypothetical protein